MPEVIPLSYYVRRQHLEVADALGIWWMFFVDSPQLQPWKRDEWTRGNMKIYEESDWGLSVIFEFNGFDPNDSEMAYGDPTTLNDKIVDHPNATLLFDNSKHGVDLDIDITKSVTLHRSRTSSTATKIAWDVGVKTKLTIGGEAAGATLESEVSANFGITTDTSTAETESTDKTVTQAVSTKVKKYASTLCKFSSPRVQQRTHFDVKGALDDPFSISWNDGLNAGNIEQLCKGPRYSASSGKRSLRFESFSDFYSMLSNYNVDFPGQVDNLNPIHRAPSGNPANNPDTKSDVEESRFLDWSGDITTSADESVLVSFEDVVDPIEAIKEYGISEDRVYTKENLQQL